MWRNFQQLVAPDPVEDAPQYPSARLPAPSGWDDEDDLLDAIGGDDHFDYPNEPKLDHGNHHANKEEELPQNGDNGWNMDEDITLDDDSNVLEEEQEDPWGDTIEDPELVDEPSKEPPQPIHVVVEDEDDNPDVSDTGWDDDDDHLLEDDDDHETEDAPNANLATVHEVERSKAAEEENEGITASPPTPMIPPMQQQQQPWITPSHRMIQQHEHDLQQQYAIIDQKSALIRSLEQRMAQMEQECDQRCRSLQTELEALAAELISTVQERDMLLMTLQTNVATIQQLQEQIEHGIRQPQEKEEEHALLQEQVSQLSTEFQTVQQTLDATQSENQQLRQQLQNAVAQAAAQAEEHELRMAHARQEQDTAWQQERHAIESQFVLERTVLQERHAAEQTAWREELDAMRREHAALPAQIAATEHPNSIEGGAQETELLALLEEQDAERSRMQTQIESLEGTCQSWQARYEDLERQNEAAIQDAVQTAQRAVENTLVIPLREECDQLRQRIVQLEGEVVSYQQSVAEHDQYVDEQAKWYDDEIQQLRQEIEYLTAQPSNPVPTEELQALRTQYEQLQAELQVRDEKARQLMLECQKLQQTASLPEEPPELEILRSRLQVVLDERDALAVENEELLVQFGYLKQKMDEYISSLQGDIQSLQSQLEEKGSGRDSEFRETVTHLEAQCKAKDQMIDTRDEQIHNLTEQLQKRDADATKTESEALSRCREQVRVLEAKCGSLQMELDSVKSQLESTEGALSAKDQLYSIQSAVYDLESSVPFRGDVSRFVHESEAHIRELELELNSKSKVVEELQESVVNLKFQLDDHEAMKDGDVDVAKKDEEIQDLKEQLESIQANLLSREDQLNRLLATEAGISAYNHMKEVDSLRSNIVSVARALQRSETSRADTIGRLVSEREAHVLQLRSMSEKLKRFYATVTYGHV